MSQSTPPALWHGRVEGPGAATPHVRSTVVGVPQAPVACASVHRRDWPSTLSGSLTVTAAQPGSFDSDAGVIATVVLQPVRLAARTAAARRGTEARSRNTCPGYRGGMETEREQTVGDLSERALLARILAAVGDASQAEVGPGDDAAVLAVPDGRVVLTTDTLVHGPDFRLAWSTGYDLGVKAAAVNLADVAAMGARPTALLVALALPDALPVAFVDELARGLRAACDRLAPGCAIEGGDLTASDTLTIAVTGVGVLDGLTPVLRWGARPGDVVAVAGELGAAARGLAILFDRFRTPDGTPLAVDAALLDATERADLDAQLRPNPPIGLGPVAARAGASALMDVSDGLLLDATRMAEASHVTIAFDGPLDDHALRGGEDHALLACFPPTVRIPDGFVRLGVVAGPGDAAVTVGGIPASGRGGWDPYRDWDAHRG